MPRYKIYSRINNRVDHMMKIGLLDEARLYYNYKNLNSLQTIGYQEIFEFFSGKKNDLNKSIEKIKRNTRRYAKRQFTWYRKDTSIIWFDSKEKNKILEYLLKKQWAILDSNQ